MRVMPCQEISDVIVCKFHIIFICGGVMRWNCIRDLLPGAEGVKLVKGISEIQSSGLNA